MGDALKTVGKIAGAAAKGAINGASSGGGLISAPFKAAKAGANSVIGITNSLSSYYHPPVRKPRKSRFKKIKKI